MYIIPITFYTLIFPAIQVHGNEVVRYNRWLEDQQGGKTQFDQFINWAFIGDFINKINEFIKTSIMILSGLLALFYFKSRFSIQIFKN